MPSMNEVIERVEAVKPSVFPEEERMRWIATLDGNISTTVMDMDVPVTYRLPEEADRPLLVEKPFDDIYELYVSAMIDFHNREYNAYNNAMLMFQERLEQYKAWYIRNHNPAKAGNFRNVMG